MTPQPKRNRLTDFRVIDGCPCPTSVAPQVYMVLRKARQTASSIYRGDAPAAVHILHAHGKHSQSELFWLSEHGTPAQREAAGLPPGGGGVNQPGRSEHECKSDGVGKPGPIGRDLPEWQVGTDSGSNTAADQQAVDRAAASFGWVVHHHYHIGIEGHHWCFDEPPHPRTLWQKGRVAFLRRALPKR